MREIEQYLKEMEYYEQDYIQTGELIKIMEKKHEIHSSTVYDTLNKIEQAGDIERKQGKIYLTI